MTSQHSLLIIAHPGHELLLHHWMETTRPTVAALSDGSGGTGASRVARSIETILAAGARPGAPFGQWPDRVLYEALLRRDEGPFAAMVDAVVELCRDNPPDTIVSDAIEHFNPVHDLCAVIAQCAAARLASITGRAPIQLELPIERRVRPRAAHTRLVLDAAAIERKRQALSRHVELRAEIDAKTGAASFPGLDTEILSAPELSERQWPAVLPEPPFYETFGQGRVEEGIYGEIIRYHDHVRPVALTLRARYPRPRLPEAPVAAEADRQ